MSKRSCRMGSDASNLPTVAAIAVALGLLLLALPIKNGKFRLLFGGLVEEKLALERHQRRRRIRRRLEIRQWIAIGQCRVQPRRRRAERP